MSKTLRGAKRKKAENCRKRVMLGFHTADKRIYILQKQNRKNKKEVETKQFQSDAERRWKILRDPRRDVFVSLTEQKNIFIFSFAFSCRGCSCRG